MSIEQPTVIDFLWKDGTTPKAVLTIADHLDWQDEAEHLWLLQDKLNHYLEFIESGQLLETKRDFKGLPVLIHVAAEHPLSEKASRFYEMVEERVAELGFSFEFDLGGKRFGGS